MFFVIKYGNTTSQNWTVVAKKSFIALIFIDLDTSIKLERMIIKIHFAQYFLKYIETNSNDLNL